MLGFMPLASAPLASGPFAPIGPGVAQYRLYCDHYMDVYLEANSIITTGLEVPDSWIPSQNVDPINEGAIRAFWDAGPRPVIDGAFGYQNGRHVNTMIPRPVIYWIPSGTQYILTGAGAIFGTRPGDTSG